MRNFKVIEQLLVCKLEAQTLKLCLQIVYSLRVLSLKERHKWKGDEGKRLLRSIVGKWDEDDLLEQRMKESLVDCISNSNFPSLHDFQQLSTTRQPQNEAVDYQLQFEQNN